MNERMIYLLKLPISGISQLQVQDDQYGIASEYFLMRSSSLILLLIVIYQSGLNQFNYYSKIN